MIPTGDMQHFKDVGSNKSILLGYNMQTRCLPWISFSTFFLAVSDQLQEVVTTIFTTEISICWKADS